jgi:PAS domain S-box-containing protein
MTRWLFLILILVCAFSAQEASAIQFTPEEQAFLHEHPVWHMAGGDSPPFQWIDEKGQFQGIAADYRALIESRLGVRLEPVPAASWTASLEQMRRRECDISLLTAQTPDRDVFLLFTDPLLVLPPVIITRTDNTWVKSLADLAGRHVTVGRSWPIQERLTRDHPEIILSPRETIDAAISAVALGDADAYVGDLASATQSIDRLGIRNLKVAAETPYTFPFRIAVRKDWPMAVALLDKAIATITPVEHDAIYHKWVSVRGEGLSWKRILAIASPSLIGCALLVLLILNRRLSREVTRRKSSEHDLRTSEERWNFALEGSRDGVWDWNVKTNEVFFSPRWKTMLGYSEEELPNRLEEWFNRIHRDDFDRALDAIQQHLRGDTPAYEVEHRVQTKDGSYVWILARGKVMTRDEAGAPSRMVGTHTDITERRRMEEALRRNEEHLEETVRQRTAELEKAEHRLREVTDRIPGAVYQLTQDADGVFSFVFCSEGMEKMVGVSSEEAVHDVQAVWNVIHPDDFAELIMKANESAKYLTRYVQDLRIQQPDGRRWWIRAESEPQRRPDGSTLWNGNIMDITERKSLEEQLAVAKAAAESASRAKSAFLANMSHEIRTPMNAILGFSQLMLRDAALTPAQRQHLDTINRSGEHLLGLINDVLEMSKIEAGRIRLQPGHFDLHALLDDLDRLFRLRTDARQLRFSIEREADLPQFVRADERKLRQIFTNLIGNAVKFTEWGGILVRVHTSGSDAGKVRLFAEVEDTGPGIAPDDLSRLFLEFEQTESGIRTGGGTGLGLAISREFVRLMGGEMKVESEIGRGTRFSFDVLIEAGEAHGVETRPDQRRVLALQPEFLGLRVLIADDTPENRSFLEQLLQPLGFQTRVVADGAQAVEEFERWLPQLVLIDLRMPVLDGYEAIRCMRKFPHGAQTPIIAVTASAFDENRRHVLEAGGDEFLGKPFREAELFEKIGRLTKVVFVYAEDATPVGNGAAVRNVVPLTRDRLASDLPTELRSRLREALIRADQDEALALLDHAPPEAEDTVTQMRNRISRFDYQSLLSLLELETMKS